MNQESGRSLMEIIGVLAIVGVMSASAISIYNVIKNNQARKIASMEIEQIAKNVKLLMELRGDYTGVSIQYLISSGALKSDKAPIGDEGWSVEAINNGKGFSINLTNLSSGECQYFATAKQNWATKIIINGLETDIDINCFSTKTNKVSFTVE